MIRVTMRYRTNHIDMYTTHNEINNQKMKYICNMQNIIENDETKRINL